MVLAHIMELFRRKRLRWVKDSFLWKAVRSIHRFFLFLYWGLAYNTLKYICALRYLFWKKALDRKTVFIIISSLSGGGAERVGTVLASELSAVYHVVILYTNKSNTKVCYPLSSDVDLMCVPFSFGQKRPPGKMLTGLIRLLKKRQSASVSISLTFNPNIINVGSRANDKIICSERNSPLKHWQDSLRFDKIQSIYEQADHVVFQSSTVRDILMKELKTIVPSSSIRLG